jgi:endonuclease-3
MVLGNAFGRQAIAVDTHVLRVANRLGLASSKNADKVEAALTDLIPGDRLTAFTNAVILHGRETCTARNPRCHQCVLNELCAWPGQAERIGIGAPDAAGS